MFLNSLMEKNEALGVGSFGPIDPDLTSPTYGYITTLNQDGIIITLWVL